MYREVNTYTVAVVICLMVNKRPEKLNTKFDIAATTLWKINQNVFFFFQSQI